MDGDTVDDLEVVLDHPLTAEIPVTLDNPPFAAEPGPAFYGALVQLGLGDDGYWELDSAVDVGPDLTVDGIPEPDGWPEDVRLLLMGMALSDTESYEPISVGRAS